MTDPSPIPQVPRVPAQGARPVHGVGVGLRYPFGWELLERRPEAVRWLEIHPENYLRRGGRYQLLLERAADSLPLVTHGLTLGFGALEPCEPEYAKALKGLLRRYRIPWHSEHLCFSSVDGLALHDLVPLPHTREALGVAVQRVRELSDALEIPVAIENISFYAHPGCSQHDRPQMDEVQFLNEVLLGADAKLLLDVNNVYVNGRNHGFDPRQYIDQIPADRVVQIHIAGHYTRADGLIIDTHGEPIIRDVYELLRYTLRRLGPVPVLLERDNQIPPLDVLLKEVSALDRIYQEALAERTAPSATEHHA